ncbi:MAG: AMP-binding protein [Polyangiaceae bacterium]
MAPWLSDVREGLNAIRGTAGDALALHDDPVWQHTMRASLGKLPPALLQTAPWMLRSRAGLEASYARIVDDNAKQLPGGLALEMGDCQWTWRELSEQASRVAHVLSALGVRAGQVVALMGKNSPHYLSTLLGISRLGATASLVNHHLEGKPLAHAVESSRSRLVLAEPEFLPAATEAANQVRVLSFRDGELEERMRRVPSRRFPRVRVRPDQDFVYIFTSGTTGLPKPCRVTHGRAVLAGAGFGPLLFGMGQGDKLYSVLPLYHSSALMIGAGSCFLTRTPLALRETFSASSFWPDVQRYRATCMLYIGELCRYLLNQPVSEAERNNPLRVAVGNGLRADVWEPFAKRFEIPDIREFYSATEAPGVIFNLTGRVGSVGHVPVRRLSPLKLARFDVDEEELIRDAEGLCIECEAGETGELLIKLVDNPKSALREFRGYTDAKATQKKIIENVFKPGDRYFRSGDLMRFDEQDYFYFVDRIGDTYRWKGENVSTAEVAEVIGRAPGVLGATVVGISVPGQEGRCGLAALEVDGELDLDAFWQTAQELPSYAQPRFVRVMGQLSTTGTFKIQKTDLRREGVDPETVAGPLYLRQDGGYVPLTPELWHGTRDGGVRL